MYFDDDQLKEQLISSPTGFGEQSPIKMQSKTPKVVGELDLKYLSVSCHYN